jgi:hypothetical protein
MVETWQPIPGFPDHEASSIGQIRRATTKKGRPAGLILKQKTRPSGYVIVSISGQKHFVHRLVCAAFHGLPKPGYETSHENGVHSDNSAGNLLWRTHAENEALKVKHGTSMRGTACPGSKVNEIIVMICRAAGRLGLGTQAELAAHFGISRATVGDIQNYQTWRHVE